MYNPFYYFMAFFSPTRTKTKTEETDRRNSGNSESIPTNSSKGSGSGSNSRPLSAKYSKGNSFKIEINLTRILSLRLSTLKTPTSSAVMNEQGVNDCALKMRNCLRKQKEQPVAKSVYNLDDLCYKKTVAKRWRQRRDDAIQNGHLIPPDISERQAFYHFTNNVPFLYSAGFQPQNTSTGILLKRGQQVYLSKEAFKPFFTGYCGITPFHSPSESYVTLPNTPEDCTVVKIVEKKADTYNDRSFEMKVWSSISLKKEYEITLGERFRIEYAICLNSMSETQFKNLNIRKSNIIHALLQENNVALFFGEQTDYLKQLNEWTETFPVKPLLETGSHD